jgi:hypothetical protein
MWGSSALYIQTELEVGKRANVEPRLIVNTQCKQMDDLSHQVKETQAARIRDLEEINAKLEVLLGLGRQG